MVDNSLKNNGQIEEGRWSMILREFDSYREYSKQSGSMDNKVVGRIHLSQQWWLIISNKSRVLAALRGW